MQRGAGRVMGILGPWVLGLWILGCGGATASPPAVTDGGGTDTPTTDTPVVQDAPDSETRCSIDCVGPPMGCHYEGPVSCNPPSCGTVVCPDAGGTDAPVDAHADVPVDHSQPDAPCVIDCPAPPMGCRYVGPVSCSPPSCGTLECPDAGAPIVCGAGGGGHFPMFDRTCMADADCVIVDHQTDCCGNSRAMGIRADQRAAFDADEAICERMYPGCGCPAGPPVADDGMSAIPPATIAVACVSGQCATFVRH